MNAMTSLLTRLLILFSALAVPISLAAQDHANEPRHHHYKLIDLGTFGGPTSGTTDELQVLNYRGMVAGTADTSVPNHPNSCVFCGSAFITHAFLWSKGALHDLRSLPGSNSSGANWISNSGLVAGFSETEAIDPILVPVVREMHAVLWRDGEIIDLGTLEGGYESAAFAVNSRGQVAGAGFNTVPDPFSFTGTQQRTFLWENGVMRDLGTLGGPDAGLLGQVGGLGIGKGNVEMNERGQVVACSMTSTINPVTGTPTVDPFLWDEEQGMIDLGTLGGTNGCAIYLNNRGQVVGYSNMAGDLTAHPFLWERGEMKDLGTLGGPSGFANWISEAGEVAGTAQNEGGFFHAFVWKNGVMTDLGTLPGDFCSYSQAVNSKGQMVGESQPVAESFPPCDFASARAFLWETGGPMVDLNTLVPFGSGLQLNGTVDINSRGEIAGIGLLANGDQHAVLLIPCDENHPDIEGCDYSLADASAATRESAASVMQKSMTTAPRAPAIYGPFNDVRRTFPGPLGSGRFVGGPQQVALSAAVAATSGPIVSLSPTSETFSTQPIGTTSAAKVVALKNTGTTSVTITAIAIVGTNVGDFEQTHTCGSSLAAGASCSISVTFKPTASGTRTATLSVTDNAPGSPQKVGLTGVGTTAKLSLTSLNFGAVVLGTSSPAKTVTLTNVGTTTLTMSGIAITGTTAGNFSQTHTCGSSLAAGASCSISVTFKPTASGARAATLSVTDNAPGSPQTVSLTGIGTTAKLSPTSLNYGTVAIGTTSPAKTVTLTNVGMTTLTISGIAISGVNAGEFAQTHSCGSSLSAGASCSISVTFKPTTSETRTATLSVTDNAPGSPQTVSLTGIGTTTKVLTGYCRATCRPRTQSSACPIGQQAITPGLISVYPCGPIGSVAAVDLARRCFIPPSSFGHCETN
jgi:probable HAF family extracellular repeat protein